MKLSLYIVFIVIFLFATVSTKKSLKKSKRIKNINLEKELKQLKNLKFNSTRFFFPTTKILPISKTTSKTISKTTGKAISKTTSKIPKKSFQLTTKASNKGKKTFKTKSKASIKTSKNSKKSSIKNANKNPMKKASKVSKKKQIGKERMSKKKRKLLSTKTTTKTTKKTTIETTTSKKIIPVTSITTTTINTTTNTITSTKNNTTTSFISNVTTATFSQKPISNKLLLDPKLLESLARENTNLNDKVKTNSNSKESTKKEHKPETKIPLNPVVDNSLSNNNNNNVYNTNNVNNNNYYIFGSKLDEILEHLPLPPPPMNLPPPPLPPILFGCQMEEYEWKLSKKNQSGLNCFTKNKEKGKLLKCDNILTKLNDIYLDTSSEQTNISAPNKFTNTFNETTDLIKEVNKKEKDTSIFNFSTWMTDKPTNTLNLPPYSTETFKETDQIKDFLKLKEVKNAETMRGLKLPEGSVIYRKDLQTPFVMTDKWRALMMTECGDGIKDKYEECDDGNSFNGDLCKIDCKLNVCGDGILSEMEVCDGNAFRKKPEIYIANCFKNIDRSYGKKEVYCSSDCSKVMCMPWKEF